MWFKTGYYKNTFAHGSNSTKKDSEGMDSMLSSLFSLSILLSRCLGTDVFNIMLSDAEQLENLSNT